MKAIINGRLLLPNMEGDFRVMEDMALLYDERIERIIDMDEVEAEAGIDEVHDAHGLSRRASSTCMCTALAAGT